MIIRLCDNCSNQIAYEKDVTQIGCWVQGGWHIFDLCGLDCITQVLEMAFGPEQAEEEEEYETDLGDFDQAGSPKIKRRKKDDAVGVIQEMEADAPTLFDEVMKGQEDDIQEDKTVFLRRKPSDSARAEKLFKEEAQRISGQQTGVTRRGYSS